MSAADMAWGTRWNSSTRSRPGAMGTLSRERSRSNTTARSSGVCGGNSATCSSARPCRLRSMGIRSGRLVMRNHSTRPRRRVSPMNAASRANTRSLVPESPPESSRLPSAASASSTTTAVGPMLSTMARMRSRLASVWPCHLERKFFIDTTGTPISAAKHCTMNVLPVPTGPHTRKPIGITSSRPARSAAAVSRSSVLAASWPATASSPMRLLTNSSRPPLFSSMSRFFSRVSMSASSGAPCCSASPSRPSRLIRVRPAVSTAAVRGSMRLQVSGVPPRSVRKANRSSSVGTGTSTSMVRGSPTSAALSCDAASAITQQVNGLRRNSGSAAQRRSVTMVERSSTGSCTASPAGASVSA